VPALVALATLVLGIWTFDPKLSLSGDDTEFITLARSLVQNQTLTYINDPNLQPATKYPFGFPLILAPLEWLFPQNWVPMKGLVLVLFALAMAFFYELVRQRLGPLPALASVALCLTTGKSYLTTQADGQHLFGPLLLHFAHQVMSEAPYLTFSLLALLLIERGAAAPGLRGNWALLGGLFCAVWAYYIRTVGLTLIGAAVVFLFLRGDFRRGLAFAGGAVLLWLPWTLRNRAVGGGEMYFKQLVMVNPYYPDQGLLDVGGLLGRLLHNAQFYLGHELPRTLWPFFEGADGVWHPVSLLLSGLAVYAVALSIRQRENLLLLLYAAFSMGVALLWFWTDARFILPVVPLLIFFAVQVFTDAVQKLERRGWGTLGRLAALALFAVVLIGNLPGVGRLAAYTRQDYPPAWSNYYQAGLWLKAHAPADAVLLCRKGFWLYIVSGRRCVGFPFEGPEQVLEHMEREGVDFAVVESLGFAQTGRFLVPAINQYRDRFQIVWQKEDPPTYVLRFLRQ
jgi:hypothetical protein